jgi:hypothetical protein
MYYENLLWMNKNWLHKKWIEKKNLKVQILSVLISVRDGARTKYKLMGVMVYF